MRLTRVSSSSWLARVAREKPRRNAARTNNGMTSELACANGPGDGRSCRSRSTAALESKASASNLNLVSPESFTYGARDAAAVFIAERARELEPGLIDSDRSRPDLDFDLLMIPNAAEWFSELEDVLFSDVLGFDGSPHVHRIPLACQSIARRPPSIPSLPIRDPNRRSADRIPSPGCCT